MGSAALFVLTVWWGATQALLWLVRIVPARALNWGALGLGTLALAAVAGSLELTGAPAAYAGFAAGLGLWAAFEIAFLSGGLVGIDTKATSPRLAARAWAAFRSIIWHELALVGTLIVLAIALVGTANAMAFHTFALLWAMRISAKLNLFLGVRNLCADFLPDSVAHLARHFRRAELNPLFPLSVLAGTLLTAFLLRAGLGPEVGAFQMASALLLATLAALGTLEHWMMVTPLSPKALFTTRPTACALPSSQPVRVTAPRTLHRSRKAYT